MALVNATDALINSSKMELLPHIPTSQNVTIAEIVSFSTLFFVIGTAGIAGNSMVIFIVLSNSKMRLSMTNMLIVNLAVSDLVILLIGIPEIVMFMMNKGWLLGQEMCKVQRFVLVAALYDSVITLLALCIERYIAIVFPIKAHIMCTRRKTFSCIITAWVVSMGMAMPTMLFNAVTNFNRSHNFSQMEIAFCALVFPYNHDRNFLVFKYIEATLFYFTPLVIQIFCYIVIGKHLFLGVNELHGRSCRQSPSPGNIGGLRGMDAISARRGVVKMLIASVFLYFISYSPHQIMLIYNTFSPTRFQENVAFLVGVTVLAYLNSAGNPIIYCILCEKYRKKFKAMLSFSRRANGKLYTETLLTHLCYPGTEFTLLYGRSSNRLLNQRNY